MRCEKEFFESLALIRGETKIDDKMYFLEKETRELFKEFSKKIYHNNPGKSLERFLAKVFREVPGVLEVKENGFGFKSDGGADLIIYYKSGIAGLGNDETMVVQVKSYDGEIWSTQAVDQIRNALSEFEASSGLIFTTAKITEKIEQEIALSSQEVNKPVYLMAGEDLARFVLAYGTGVIM